MNIVITVSVIIIALAILVALFFLISTLIQVQRTARQAELVLNKINNDINVIGSIVEDVSYFTQKLSSPVIKIGAVVGGLVSMFIKRHHKKDDSN